jgi:hypothetical protein
MVYARGATMNMQRQIPSFARVLMLLVLALPFTACQKQAAPAEAGTEAAAVKMPASIEDTDGWKAYFSDVVTRNVPKDLTNNPFAYFLPPPTVADFDAQFGRMLDKTKSDLARGILPGNMIAFGSPDSAKTADLMVQTFAVVAPGSMKGVRVLFLGAPADNDRVRAAVGPSGAEYVFVEAK